MKPEKPSLKKTVKNVTSKIRKSAASVAARLTKTPATPVKAVAASAPKQPSKTTTPKTKAAAKPAAPETPEIPAILLEGDHPSSPPAAGPGQRYSLGAVPPPEHVAGKDAGELPEAYGTEQLLLTARDPHWLYARWDLTRAQQRKYNSLSSDHHLVLRIYLSEIKGEPASEVHVHPESTHWFLYVNQAGAKYLAQLGYYMKGKWTTVSTSSATLTPPDSLSDDTSVQFASIPMDVPFTQLMQLARTAVEQNIPLVEVVQQLRADGYNFPPARPGEKWTPARQQALAAIITMDSVRRVWMGSLEITELTRRQLAQDMSSLGVGQFSAPSSPLGGLSSITSLSSAFGGAYERRKSFWFNVNAELIIYGATEPDAEVTIGGRVIKLRPDGTFSYRFSLPDGQYELPAVAISADKTDGRAAELRFERATEYRGDVGQHPQDSRLKPPLVENVA
jgi:hypothetical protein